MDEKSSKEIEWKERNVHGNDGDDEDFNRDVVFDLFGPKEEPYEDVEYEFPGIPKIVIRGQTEMANSTGLVVGWNGSEGLCEYLIDQRDMIAKKKVLELGAGVGTTGIVASGLGASSVTLTDGDTSVLELLRHNISQNEECCKLSPSVTCRQLIWDENLHLYEKADVMLVLNCVYMPQALKPLFKTIRELLEPDGVVIYVNPNASLAPLDLVLETAESFKLKWKRSKHVGKLETIEVFLFEHA